MRRAATVLLTAALTSAGLAALPRRRRHRSMKVRDLTITVTGLGPENRTCEIDADLYVPAGVTRTTGPPRCWRPTASAAPRRTRPTSPWASASTGYVTLSYTGIGFVDGDACPITLDDVEHDGAAASQLIRFLGGDRGSRPSTTPPARRSSSTR